MEDRCLAQVAARSLIVAPRCAEQNPRKVNCEVTKNFARPATGGSNCWTGGNDASTRIAAGAGNLVTRASSPVRSAESVDSSHVEKGAVKGDTASVRSQYANALRNIVD
jgi:hypothetical protein